MTPRTTVCTSDPRARVVRGSSNSINSMSGEKEGALCCPYIPAGKPDRRPGYGVTEAALQSDRQGGNNYWRAHRKK